MVDQKRIHKGFIRYLKLTGCEILSEDYDGFIVIHDNEGLAFVNPNPSDNHVTRKKFEDTMFNFLTEHDDYIDVKLRYDIIEMVIVSENRGIIKHHIDADKELE